MPENISNNFAEKYQDLYNTVSFDTEDLSKIRQDVNNAIHLLGFDCNCIFGCAEIREAIGKLKPGKNDGDVGLSSDYFINPCDELSVHTALLFSSLAVHGFAPCDVPTSTVIPIPKGNNANVTESANFAV